MKKRFTLVAVVLCTFAMMTSCVKEDSLNLPEGAIVLSSEKHHGLDKTSVSGTSVWWVNNDVVKLNGTEYPVIVTESQSSTVAYIMANEIGSGTGVYGWSPASLTTSWQGGEDPFTIDMPDVYTSFYNAGRQVIDMPMVAREGRTEGKAIKFKHLSAGINVRVKNGGTGSIVLDSVVVSSGNYYLSGSTSVTVIGDNSITVNPESIATAGTTSSVKVNFTGNPTIEFDHILDVQVPIRPVGNNADLTVKVCIHNASDPSILRIFNSQANISGTLGRNEMLTVGCNMNGSHSTEGFNPLVAPLTFEAKTANCTVTFNRNYGGATLQYSTDGGTTWSESLNDINVTLANVGDKVSFRGNNTTMYNTTAPSTGNGGRFTGTGECYLYGNVMSLLYASDYATATELPEGTLTFYGLFYLNTSIHSHPTKRLVLPATTLREQCYAYMFQGCTSLTTAPELPATTLASSCYSTMFYGCSSLIVAPELPAETLAYSCYSNMFQNCTSLTTAPVLPARTLTYYCYNWMFGGCTSLSSVTCLATSRNSDYTDNWLSGVAATGTFTAINVSNWPEGNHGIPAGWTRVEYSE